MKWSKRYLALAEHVASWSKDPDRQVGAVVTQDREFISLGYNGYPRSIRDTLDHQKLLKTVHAELNAILHAKGVGNTIYVWPCLPCSLCMGAILQVGIARIVVPTLTYPTDSKWANSWETSLDMAVEAGVDLIGLEDLDAS